jgi:uncharacterized protein YggE
MKKRSYYGQNKISVLIILCLFFAVQISFGQISGNQAFANSNRNYNDKGEGLRIKQEQVGKLYLSDTSFLVQAKIVKNVKADHYIAVFGLSQEAKNVVMANTKINERVKNFISGLQQTGIKENDIYTDIIAQYRVYDLKKESTNEVQEYLKGFELSKNIIIKYSKPAQIEQMLILAAKDSIFDLIKVDYCVENISKIYEDLFQSATEIIKKKKELYLNLTEAEVKPNAQIYGEVFSSYYPTEMYKSYQAYSTNFYESYWWYNDRKIAMRKFTTFYYDKLDYSGFDKVINPTVLEPVVEFVLTLQVKYNLKK